MPYPDYTLEDIEGHREKHPELISASDEDVAKLMSVQEKAVEEERKRKGGKEMNREQWEEEKERLANLFKKERKIEAHLSALSALIKLTKDDFIDLVDTYKSHLSTFDEMRKPARDLKEYAKQTKDFFKKDNKQILSIDWKKARILKTLKGHTSWVSSLILLPNGNIASGSFDSTIRIWGEK